MIEFNHEQLVELAKSKLSKELYEEAFQLIARVPSSPETIRIKHEICKMTEDYKLIL